jgi:hypothetical protein
MKCVSSLLVAPRLHRLSADMLSLQATLLSCSHICAECCAAERLAVSSRRWPTFQRAAANEATRLLIFSRGYIRLWHSVRFARLVHLSYSGKVCT